LQTSEDNLFLQTKEISIGDLVQVSSSNEESGMSTSSCAAPDSSAWLQTLVERETVSIVSTFDLEDTEGTTTLESVSEAYGMMVEDMFSGDDKAVTRSRRLLPLRRRLSTNVFPGSAKVNALEELECSTKEEGKKCLRATSGYQILVDPWDNVELVSRKAVIMTETAISTGGMAEAMEKVNVTEGASTIRFVPVSTDFSTITKEEEKDDTLVNIGTDTATTTNCSDTKKRSLDTGTVEEDQDDPCNPSNNRHESYFHTPYKGKGFYRESRMAKKKPQQ